MKMRYIPLLLILVVFAGCSRNEILNVTPPTLAEFAFSSNATTAMYYIEPDSEFKIPVGLTNIATENVTLNFSYTSSAAQGGQFTAPASLTIAAGKAVDTLRIKGLFTGYPTTTRSDELKIKITSANVDVNMLRDSFVVTMRKFCPVSVNALLGEYKNANEYLSDGTFSWGPYTAAVTLVSNPGTGDTAWVKLVNLYDDGWNDLNAKLDWTNKAALKVTVPLQPTGRSYNSAGAPAVAQGTYVRSSTSTAASNVNTFSSCNNTITVSLDLVNGSNVYGSNYQFRLAK